MPRSGFKFNRFFLKQNLPYSAYTLNIQFRTIFDKTLGSIPFQFLMTRPTLTLRTLCHEPNTREE